MALLFLEKCSFPRGKKCSCGVESARRRDRKRYPEPIVLVLGVKAQFEEKIRIYVLRAVQSAPYGNVIFGGKAHDFHDFAD